MGFLRFVNVSTSWFLDSSEWDSLMISIAANFLNGN